MKLISSSEITEMLYCRQTLSKKPNYVLLTIPRNNVSCKVGKEVMYFCVKEVM